MQKFLLLQDLMKFSNSKPRLIEKIKYCAFSLIYLYILEKEMSAKKSEEHSFGSQAGDDIYPLF